MKHMTRQEFVASIRRYVINLILHMCNLLSQFVLFFSCLHLYYDDILGRAVVSLEVHQFIVV